MEEQIPWKFIIFRGFVELLHRLERASHLRQIPELSYFYSTPSALNTAALLYDAFEAAYKIQRNCSDVDCLCDGQHDHFPDTDFSEAKIPYER